MEVGPTRWVSWVHDIPSHPRVSKTVAAAVLAARMSYLTWRLSDGWRCLTTQHPEVVLHPPMRGGTNRLARRIAECYEAANRLTHPSVTETASYAPHLTISTPAACAHRSRRLAERTRDHAQRWDSRAASDLTLIEKANSLLLLFTAEADCPPQDLCSTTRSP